MTTIMDSVQPAERMVTSKKHEELLDMIDALRSKGVSHFVDLPQLIVCGDQSSGKSSVLEALSGLNFPRKETLCTRFATEVILRRGNDHRVDVSIIPASGRTEEELHALEKFNKTNITLDKISEVITNTEEGMGINGTTKHFSKDVLRIEVSGPKHPNLTLVDLPGLIHAPGRNQTENDVKAVEQLVLGYMKSKRSIILGVISAKNDINNQVVVAHVTNVDPGGNRTLGIITKPDTLHVGSESEKEFFELAQNKVHCWDKGFHVVRNRDFTIQHVTTEQRDQIETDFFSRGIWSGLSSDDKGVESLKLKLSDILREQIVTELPSLITEIEKAAKDTRSRLQRLGGSRETPDQQRIHLLRVSQLFVGLVKGAVDGQYDDPFFQDKKKGVAYNKRLRAVIQNHLADFATELKENGQTHKLVDKIPEESDDEDGSDDEYQEEPVRDKKIMLRRDFIDDVAELMRQTRGRELVSDYNSSIVGKLFAHQSQEWAAIVNEYVDILLDSARTTLNMILDHSSDKQTAEGIRELVINPGMIVVEKSVREKANLVIKPYQGGHPITYDPTLIALVRKKDEARLKNYWTAAFMDSLKESGETSKVNKTTGFFQSSKPFDFKKLINSACEGYMQDEMHHACNRAIDTMEAYYDIAKKNLVDAFSTLAIEECMMQKLAHLFEPETAHRLSDEDVKEITAESVRSANERKSLEEKLKVLEAALATLHRLKKHEPRVNSVASYRGRNGSILRTTRKRSLQDID